jgi:hypothetical protein
MPHHESSPEQSHDSWLELLRAAIIDGHQRIEDEFADSKQNWLNCFATVLGQIKLNLEFIHEDQSLPEIQIQNIESVVSELEKTFTKYRQEFSGVNQPPQKVRDELLGYLDTLQITFKL